jgi:hypothetical protein
VRFDRPVAPPLADRALDGAEIFDYASREPRGAFVRTPVAGTDDYWFDAEASASSAFRSVLQHSGLRDWEQPTD